MNKRKANINQEENLIENFEDNIINLSKRRKISNEWISGTTIANYLNGEPLLDWLKLYYNKYGFNNTRVLRSMTKKNNSNLNSNSNFNFDYNELISNGLLFENKIYEDLKKKFLKSFIKIDINKTNKGEIDFNSSFNETLKYINLKTPIIAQAVLIDNQTHLRGIADLLVRYDFINKIFKKNVVNITEQNKNKYIVIDIKWTNMTLCVDGKTIRNEGRFKAYKGQLFIYNYILSKIQNYTSPISLIIAKNWKIDSTYNKMEGYCCYDTPGIIDYTGKDSIFIKKTFEAIEWIYKVREEGLKYSPLNPTIKEMCVNSSNTNDNNWKMVKKEILKKTKDITQVWNLTQKHRDYAFDKNIKSWDSEDCTTENLNMNKTKTSNIIDKILNINRQNDYLILPNKIKDNQYNWKKQFPTDFFIDFETTSEYVQKLEDINIYNSKLNSQIIFMIGVGYVIEDEFNYKYFKITELTQEEEKRILKEFIEFISLLKSELDPKHKYNTRLFHWSNAEPKFIEYAFQKYNSIEQLWNNCIKFTEWIDLCDIFIQEPIVIKGALTFKLKEISNALYSNGLINTNWNDTNITDGLNAMNESIKYYTSDNPDDNIMENIIKYNKVDCKVLWEILNLLRTLN
jgi:hypothetical protein